MDAITIATTLWIVSGLAGWLFLGFYWKSLAPFKEWTFYLLIYCACVAGPFIWVVPLIEGER